MNGQDGDYTDEIYNGLTVLMIVCPHKIHYMHQVDERKMGHAAKTR